MRGVFLVGLMLSTPVAASTGAFSGLYPGMNARDAYRILATIGSVQNGGLPGGSTYMMVPGLNVSLCPGGSVVAAVTHNLEGSFASFARTAQLAEAKRGKGSFRVYGGENDPPTYTIEESWVDASDIEYDVSYGSYGTSGGASESLYRRCPR